MAKKDVSKTNVSVRMALKLKQSTCRFCGKTPEVARVLTPEGKAQMVRKCCEATGIAA